MSFCILGQAALEPITVEGAENINTSYPEFATHLRRLGGQVELLSVTPAREQCLG